MFPEESSFHDERFERDLQELLETFVAYRPDIGYFDGLNYVSAMLLQFQDEESAFTSTVNLFTQYLSNAVDPEMKDKFKEYCAAFSSAMEEEVPDVRSAFQENKVDVAVILRDWIYSLFSRCVNFEDAKRLWDILLLEGPFGIVKIALGILKMFAGELCDMRSKEVYAFLKNLPPQLDIDELAKSVGPPEGCDADQIHRARAHRLDHHSRERRRERRRGGERGGRGGGGEEGGEEGLQEGRVQLRLGLGGRQACAQEAGFLLFFFFGLVGGREACARAEEGRVVLVGFLVGLGGREARSQARAQEDRIDFVVFGLLRG